MRDLTSHSFNPTPFGMNSPFRRRYSVDCGPRAASLPLHRQRFPAERDLHQSSHIRQTFVPRGRTLSLRPCIKYTETPHYPETARGRAEVEHVNHPIHPQVPTFQSNLRMRRDRSNSDSRGPESATDCPDEEEGVLRHSPPSLRPPNMVPGSGFHPDAHVRDASPYSSVLPSQSTRFPDLSFNAFLPRPAAITPSTSISNARARSRSPSPTPFSVEYTRQAARPVNLRMVSPPPPTRAQSPDDRQTVQSPNQRMVSPPPVHPPTRAQSPDNRQAVQSSNQRMGSPPLVRPQSPDDVMGNVVTTNPVAAGPNPRPRAIRGRSEALPVNRPQSATTSTRRVGRWSRSASPGAKHLRFSSEVTIGGNDNREETSTFQPRHGIPKPSGQVTRLNRGGYSLIDALGWSDEQYKEIQTLIHNLAIRYLQLDLSYSKQDPEVIERVCSKACTLRPILRGYEEQWHIKDFLKIYLQNSSRDRRIAPNHS